MAAPVLTQGTSLETQSIEVLNAMVTAVNATPAAARGQYSASKSANLSGKTITFTITYDATELLDDQVSGLAPKVVLI
jgi:hypothetical protein